MSPNIQIYILPQKQPETDYSITLSTDLGRWHLPQNMAIMLLVLCLTNLSTAEIIQCDSGDCSCDETISNRKCILDCTASNSCTGYVTCRAGDNCEVLCTSATSCQGANIFGIDAMDLTVNCSGTDACAEGLGATYIACGSGDCKIQCGLGSCSTYIYTQSASSFECYPLSNCDSLLNINMDNTFLPFANNSSIQSVYCDADIAIVHQLLLDHPAY